MRFTSKVTIQPEIYSLLSKEAALPAVLKPRTNQQTNSLKKIFKCNFRIRNSVNEPFKRRKMAILEIFSLNVTSNEWSKWKKKKITWSDWSKPISSALFIYIYIYILINNIYLYLLFVQKIYAAILNIKFSYLNPINFFFLFLFFFDLIVISLLCFLFTIASAVPINTIINCCCN